MKTYTLFTLSLALALTACHRQPESSLTRRVFDAGNLKVITSSVNKKLESMSILYGNAPAYQAALAANGQPRAGAQYTLVTWKYHDNPAYEGSQITGELLSIEKLSIPSAADAATSIDYRVEEGTVLPVNGAILNREDRIQYILDHRPSMLP